MPRVLKWSVDHAKTVILLLTAMTLVLGYQIKNLRIEPDITKSLPQNIPAKRLYDRMGELFPSKDFIMVVYVSDSLFSIPSIRTLDRLTREMENFPELYTLISPTNVKIIRASDGGMEVKEALQALPRTRAEVEAFKQRLQANPIFMRNLISRDQHAAAIMLLLHNDVDAKVFAGKLIKYIDDFAAKNRAQLYAAGTPVVNYYISEGVARDMRVFFNAGILLMLVLLFTIFRT
ncbi:MAG: hypothetical protein D6814_01230, partial [Calditrichaeota bacterium]